MYLFKIFSYSLSFIAKEQRHFSPSTFLENKALFDE